MGKSPDVTIEVCVALIREHLAGYRGYPNDAGERRFAFALQENCLSVGHVRETLKTFDEGFPTVRQIHDVAFNLRPQFEPRDDQRAELERKYGKPEAVEKFPADALACHWQAFRDALYYCEGLAASGYDRGYWEYSLAKAEREHPESVAFVRGQVMTLGWSAIMALSSSPFPFPYQSLLKRSRAGSIAQIAAPITREDIERAERANREKVAREAEQEAEIEDGWTDPDRE